MKRVTLLSALVFIAFFTSITAEAKVWRINLNIGAAADFREISTAVANSAVVSGDTLYVEGSAVNYTSFTLSKKLVFIGAGYLLSGTSGNPDLQHNPNPSRCATLQIDSLGSGSTFIGMSGVFYINSNVDDITLTRCEIQLYQNSSFPNSRVSNLVINKSYGSFSLPSYLLENPQITNNILTTSCSISNVLNGLVRNNVFVSTLTVNNSYIANNIFYSTLVHTSCTVKYNIGSAPGILPAGNNNQNNISPATLFVGGASGDGRYQLRPGSPAIGAGEPILGVTPDIGAFGTADPYRLSGIPAIPTIYALTSPGSVPASATTIPVTFSTRSNN